MAGDPMDLYRDGVETSGWKGVKGKGVRGFVCMQKLECDREREPK